MLRTSCPMRRTWRTVRRTVTASNALGRASSVPSADVWREEPAMNVRAERPRADRGKEGNLKAGRPFQNLQRFMAREDTMAAKGR